MKDTLGDDLGIGSRVIFSRMLMNRPPTYPISEESYKDGALDCRKTHKMALPKSPGRIGFTRFIYVAVHPPWRRNACKEET